MHFSPKVAFVVLWVLLTVLVLRFGGRRAGFQLAVLLLPASGLFVDLGLSLSAGRIAQLVLAVCFLFGWVRGTSTGRIQALAGLFLVYACAVAIIGSAAAPPVPFESEAFRVRLRPAVQWFSMGLQMLPVFLAPLMLRSKHDVLSITKAFFWGHGLLALGGLLHWGSYWLWDVNFFPIYRDGLFGEEQAVGQFAFGEGLIFRANSLAREPKDMAASLTLAVIAWMLLRDAGAIKSIVTTLAFIPAAIAAIVLSFATTGAVLLAVGVTALVAAGAFRRIFIPVHRTPTQRGLLTGVGAVRSVPFALRVAGFTLIVAIAATTLGILGESATSRVRDAAFDLWHMRVVDRIGALEEYDEVTIDFLLNNPRWAVIGVGAGNLPRYGFAHLQDDRELLQYTMNLTWDAKSGLLKIIGSYGVLGLLLIILIVGVTVRRVLLEASREGAENARWLAGAASIVSFVFAVHLFRGVDDVLWLAIGVAAVLPRLLRQEAAVTSSRLSDRRRAFLPSPLTVRGGAGLPTAVGTTPDPRGAG